MNADNPFYWRFALRGTEVPPDTEEHAAGFYERGEYERADAIFRLFIDCFDGYAEGYNYLGLIALQQDKLDEALGHFQKTIELGRKLSQAHEPQALLERPFDSSVHAGPPKLDPHPEPSRPV